MRKADVLKDLAAQEDAIKAFQAKGIPNLTTEDGQAFDAACDKVDKLKADLARIERAEKLAGVTDMTEQRRVPAQVHDNHEDRPFASLGDQMRSIIATASGTFDPRLMQLRAASGLNEAVGSEGGFFVQKDFATELIQEVHDQAELAPRCRHIPVSTAADGVTINGIDESSRANGSRWGGVVAYWQGEADDLTASKPKFRKIQLTLKKLTGLCYLTDDLMKDAAALESVVRQAFAEEFAFKVDDAILRGTGGGQPLGVLGAPCLVTVAKEAGQAADTVVYNNIKKMWSRMPGRLRAGAVWYINQNVEPELYGLTQAVGTGGSPVFLPPGGASDQPYSRLFARPVVPIEQASTLGDVGDIILANFSQYVMLDKGGMESAISAHVRFLNDETVIRFVLRTDGQPYRHAAMTPANGTATQSPFVVLAERA